MHETIGDLNKRKERDEEKWKKMNGEEEQRAQSVMDIKVYWNCFVNIMSECLGHKVHEPADEGIKWDEGTQLKLRSNDFTEF